MVTFLGNFFYSLNQSGMNNHPGWAMIAVVNNSIVLFSLAFAALSRNSFAFVLGCITSWYSISLFLLHFAWKLVFWC